MTTKKTQQKSIALHLIPTRHRRSKRQWVRWLGWVGMVVGGLLVLLLLVAAYYYPKAKRVIADARAAQAIGKTISTHVSQQQFASAKTDVDHLQQKLTTTTTDLHRMAGLRWWPYLGRQYTAADNLLRVGHDATDAVSPMIDFMQHLFAPFSGRGKITLASISPKDKGLLLSGIADREESLRQAQTAIHRAADDFDRIPTTGLLPQLSRLIVPMKQQLPVILQAVDQAIPATHLIPPLLGYPDPKTYLFLLENNTELRPGGGFIGTYGLMKVASGEVTSLHTDNSYNLDEHAKKLAPLTPPLPMQLYLKQHAWYFRDANWSPDFPTSAQQALTLYQREGGSRNVNGVLAVTPTAISALLKLVGPIRIGKTEFNSENFTDKLQYYVDQGYTYAGQDITQRKDIIGILTTELMNRLLSLPLANWKDLFLVMSQQLDQKQVPFYVTDATTQGLLERQNWAGAVSPVSGADYVLVADANLASLKTDPTVYRTYRYSVTLTDEGAEATLTVHYDHRGKFDWKTTRYNTYVRVYVPAGSQLLDSQGAQIREHSTKSGSVTATSELGQTVFGAFKSIEPGTSSDLVLHYRLPESIAQQLKQHTYTVVVQKEAGLTNAQLDLTVSSSQHQPRSTSGLDNIAVLEHNSVKFSGPLTHDRTITITY